MAESRKDPLILALDTHDLAEAREFLAAVRSLVHYVKIGPRLWAQGGAAFLGQVSSQGYEIFLDLKLHDIPNTVAGAVDALSDLGLWALTLHAGGGREMLEAAVSARNDAESEMVLLGVSVLTSLDASSFERVCPGCRLEDAIRSRTELCVESGMDGLVCSPLDLPEVKKTAGESLVTVVPGIRPWRAADDQKRSATPLEAIRNGADYLVVGRPIIQSEDPKKTILEILEQMEEGFRCRRN
jgi:orotidine-5'-phosphate decarboxylase